MASKPLNLCAGIMLRSSESPAAKSTSHCALNDRRGRMEGGMWAAVQLHPVGKAAGSPVESTWGLALNASGAPGSQA